jgi:DnaJ domain
MDTRTYQAYRTLGLKPGASHDEVRQAHRDLAQVWHPDRFAGNERLRQKADRNLQRINEAFAQLRDMDPPADVSVSRITTSLSAILDLGDLVQGTATYQRPRGPVRTGPRRTILGLSVAPERHDAGRTVLRVAAVVGGLAAIGASLFVLLSR